jgi:hypothetical protein
MNEFIEYVCRGVIRSEDAIKNLNRSVRTLAKCNRNLRAGLICFGISGLLLTLVVAEQDKEIKALKKQVSNLAAKDETEETADNTEEQNEQEGA